MMNGEGKLIFPTGTTIHGMFKNSGIVGDVEVTFKNQDKYVGKL